MLQPLWSHREPYSANPVVAGGLVYIDGAPVGPAGPYHGLVRWTPRTGAPVGRDRRAADHDPRSRAGPCTSAARTGRRSRSTPRRARSDGPPAPSPATAGRPWSPAISSSHRRTTPDPVSGVDAQSGRVVWKKFDSTAGSDPAFANGTLYVIGQDGKSTPTTPRRGPPSGWLPVADARRPVVAEGSVFVVDTTSARSTPLREPAVVDPDPLLRCTGGGGRHAVLRRFGALVAIDDTTGPERWRVPAGSARRVSREPVVRTASSSAATTSGLGLRRGHRTTALGFAAVGSGTVRAGGRQRPRLRPLRRPSGRVRPTDARRDHDDSGVRPRLRECLRRDHLGRAHTDGDQLRGHDDEHAPGFTGRQTRTSSR